MSYRFRRLQIAGGLALISCLMPGCRQDMHNQPKMFPLRGSEFFADHRGARQQVPGTVARLQGQSGSYFETGLIHGVEGNVLPFPATYTVLRRGQERFNVFCAPCHSRVGNGQGMIVERGYYPAANFQDDRLIQAPLGHFFFVMTHGLGAMPSYAAQVTPQDRWAIAAYIRALQLSQHAKLADVPPGTPVASLADLLARAGRPKTFLGSWIPPYQLSGIGAQLPSAAEKGNPARGQKIYMRNCSACHQANRAGMPPVFPSLIGIVDRVGEEKVRSVIRTGISGTPMPPHPNLSHSDMDDLIQFLRTK